MTTSKLKVESLINKCSQKALFVSGEKIDSVFFKELNGVLATDPNVDGGSSTVKY